MTIGLFFTVKFFALAWQMQPKMNEKLFLKDPEQSEVGKNIFRNSIKMIKEIGFEAFTFKKLAEEIHSTEATIYRYFENKHRLLSYIVAWYWHWLDFQVTIQTNNITNPQIKLQKIIDILTWQLEGDLTEYNGIELEDLHQIMISESSKVYLTKHVAEDNQFQLFKPYKALCEKISLVMKEYNPQYLYSKSLSSTMVESAHFQDFFIKNLPSLTDFTESERVTYVRDYLSSLIFAALNQKQLNSTVLSNQISSS